MGAWLLGSLLFEVKGTFVNDQFSCPSNGPNMLAINSFGKVPDWNFMSTVDDPPLLSWSACRANCSVFKQLLIDGQHQHTVQD